MKKTLIQAAFMRIKLSIFLLTVSSMVAGQTSDGTMSLPSKVVISTHNSQCSMTDVSQSFFNERSPTCAQGQTGFANGENRFVDSGEGNYASQTLYLGGDITSCACTSNGTWTRTMENVSTSASHYIHWRWLFFARKADCSLELKRDVPVIGCWYPISSGGCNCPEGWTCDEGGGGACQNPSSPIVIDLDGNGIKLTSKNNGVLFDLDSNGEAGMLPWLEYGSDDGWLVFNYHQDGLIKNGRQLFGDHSAQGPEKFKGEAPNGYRALRGFDDDKDNVITRRDGVWNLLGIWKDPNHNGVSDPGEVTGLTANGITSISLDYKTSGRVDRFGNRFRFRAKVIKDGKERYSYDVFLTATS